MMTLPNLPTDNLYKFVGLSGLVIVIACAFYWITMLNALNNSIAALEPEVALLRVEADFVEDDLELVKKLDRKMLDSIAGSPNKSSQNSALVHSTRNLERKLTLIDSKQKILTKERNDFIYLSIVLLGCFGVGLLLMRYGFLQWSEKIQRPLDERIQLELKLLRAQVKQSKKGRKAKWLQK